MTRGAYRRIHRTTPYDELSVDPLQVILSNSYMTLSTRIRDVEMVNGRLWIGRAQDTVGCALPVRISRRVAIIARGVDIEPFAACPAVNAACV